MSYDIIVKRHGGSTIDIDTEPVLSVGSAHAVANHHSRTVIQFT